MLIANLKLVFDQNKKQNSLYVRNLLKEQLQYYLLNFVYNSTYAGELLFKGGTALRFCFDLPRLSENLDFDVNNLTQFNFNQFGKDIKSYFQSQLKFEGLNIKISGKNKIIYLQFPISTQIGFPVSSNKPSENNFFLRIDIAEVKGTNFKQEISLKSTADFAFLIKRYSLADLFAGKLAAILQRESWQGKTKVARFKGRDYFDIFWLDSKGAKPNLPYLKSILKVNSQTKLKQLLTDKFNQARKRKMELKQDLLPFFRENRFVDNFMENFEIFTKNFSL